MVNRSNAAWRLPGGGTADAAFGRLTSVSDYTAGQSEHQTAIAVRKRGRSCVVAKLVVAEPLGELVIAMPYRHRQVVHVVSLPPMVLDFVRKQGARTWVVRLDGLGQCYALPLAEVEHIGWLKSSDGQPEWFVSLERFTPITWQDWPFVERIITVEESTERPRQISLWSVLP